MCIGVSLYLYLSLLLGPIALDPVSMSVCVYIGMSLCLYLSLVLALTALAPSIYVSLCLYMCMCLCLSLVGYLCSLITADAWREKSARCTALLFRVLYLYLSVALYAFWCLVLSAFSLTVSLSLSSFRHAYEGSRTCRPSLTEETTRPTERMTDRSGAIGCSDSPLLIPAPPTHFERSPWPQEPAAHSPAALRCAHGG